LECDGTRAETRIRFSAKRTNPFKSARASVQSTTGSRGVRISGSNAGYTVFRGSVKGTGYPLHSPVSPSLPLPYVTVRYHISAGLYSLHCCHYDVMYPSKYLQRDASDRMEGTPEEDLLHRTKIYIYIYIYREREREREQH